MESHGKLVLSLPGGAEQAFDLAKNQVSIGRDAVNDIPLQDNKISRLHAQLQFLEDGLYFVDLGSANGSLVNGKRVQRERLAPGDIIQLGGSTLRYEAELLSDPQEIYAIDSLTDFEHTMAQESVNFTLYDTNRARLVIHTPEKTWEVTLKNNRLTIGRTPDNDICIPHPKVSRRHAEIEPQEDGYVLRDLGSTNGTFLGSNAVTEHRFETGDTLRIGSAKLVFKAAFGATDLTLVEQPITALDAPQGHLPVVFVPGLMGSELWAGRERVWPNPRLLFANPEVLALPEKLPLEPRGILNEVVIVPNLIKQEQYNRLGDYLVQDLKYTRGVDLMEFAYDWRQDVRQSALRLAQAIEAWNVKPPFVLIAHSLGCLVSRYYIERLGGKSKIDRAIFLGGPHYGVPKAIANLILKVDLLPFGLLGDRLRNVLATFPSLYQILPIFNAVFDQSGAPIQVLDDESWLPEEKRPLLRAAREFRHELSRRVSVPSVSIFGYGIKTVNRIGVQRTASGDWTKLDLNIEESGDSTIPDSSTVLEGSELHPVTQHHGSLYVDNDVKMRLKLELTGRRRRA